MKSLQILPCFLTPAPSPKTISLQSLEMLEEDCWDKFVHQCCDASFFHLSGWKKILEDALQCKTHYIAAIRNQHIEGILPLAHIDTLGCHRLVSLPFCVYGGIAAKNQLTHDLLNTHSIDLGHQTQVTDVQLRYAHQSAENNRMAHPIYHTFQKTLADFPSIESLNFIPRKQRAILRKAQKMELTTSISHDLNLFFQLYQDNMHRQGSPSMPKRYFQALLEQFENNCDILTVFHQGKALSSVLSFYFKDKVMPYYAGDRNIAREYHANDYKYWQLMLHAYQRGYTCFDYGRSKLGTGAFHFKKHWGFSPTPLFYSHFPIHKKPCALPTPLSPQYQWAIKVWRYLPRPIVNKIGPLLVKRFA